ncbi:MAG: ATP phosphoribosyltransferase [Halanaerobiales bacterium]
MGELITALPKGRMMKPVVKILKTSGLISSDFDIDSLSRELVFEDVETGNSFLLAKPKDVPAYVEHGAADIGITGKDVIMEHGKKLYELLDLGISKCKLVVAARKADNIKTIDEVPEHSRIATSYPEITRNFFERKGIQVEVIYLYGSVELAPLVELADFIVDITSTGTTLRKNDLIPVAEIMTSSARLIVNNVSYKTRYEEVKKLINKIKE